MVASKPSLSERLLSVANYLGLAPLLHFSRAKRQDVFFDHHFKQAMAIGFCPLLIGLGFCLINAVEYLLVRLFPHVAEQFVERWNSFFQISSYIIGLLIIVLAIIWIVSMMFALCGSARPIPLLKQLARQHWVTCFSLFCNSLLLAAAPITIACALHANSLTQTCRAGASVYFLYDEGIGVPRWFYNLGMYRISLQAERNWGKNCTVVDRLTQANLRTALADGKVVFLATHGDYGYAFTFYAVKLAIGPAGYGVKDERNNSHFLSMCVLDKNYRYGKWEQVPVGNDLQLVYIFACNGGELAAQWKEHLFPAQVIAYDRLSTLYDHAYWFAIAGPSIMEKLKK